jgi:hypothetical protein
MPVLFWSLLVLSVVKRAWARTRGKKGALSTRSIAVFNGDYSPGFAVK